MWGGESTADGRGEDRKWDTQGVHSSQTQCACTYNMTRFTANKLLGNSKTVSKRQKIRPLWEREALNIKYSVEKFSFVNL